jgi:replication factor C subunit 3/5
MNISFFDDKPNIDDLDFKSNLLVRFKNFNVDNMIHIIFYGYKSSGKSTKIYAFLSSILDKKIYDLKNCIFEDDKKQMNYKSSIYHIEFSPLNLGSNEKLFIHSFLKSYIETKNIGLDIPKIVLIKDASFLSKQSQLSLRRMIEKNSKTVRFIFEVTSLSNFAQPLISRCLLFRVEMPTISEIKNCLINYSIKNNINITEKELDNIIIDSNKVTNIVDLKKIFGFYRYYIIANKKINFLYYDKFIEILNFITQKRVSFINIIKIREIINDLYINIVSMEELLLFLFNKIFDMYKNDNNFIEKLIKLVIHCDINLKKGNKECIHIEYFAISVIELLQKE